MGIPPKQQVPIATPSSPRGRRTSSESIMSNQQQRKTFACIGATAKPNSNSALTCLYSRRSNQQQALTVAPPKLPTLVLPPPPPLLLQQQKRHANTAATDCSRCGCCDLFIEHCGVSAKMSL